MELEDLREGMHVKITQEGIDECAPLIDCSTYCAYLVKVRNDGITLFIIDDVDDEVLINQRRAHYMYDASKPIQVDKFQGYTKVQDFETIIDYAIASNDLALFNECVQELEKRGWLEQYVQSCSLVPSQ